MSVVADLFNLLLQILSIVCGGVAFMFGCNFYDRFARRYRPGQTWFHYLMPGLVGLAFSAFATALWLVSVDQNMSAVKAFVAGVTFLLLPFVWTPSSKKSRLKQVAEVVEGMTSIQCEDIGRGNVKLTDPTPDRLAVEIVYCPRCIGLETPSEPKIRNEMVIFTFNRVRYSITFKEDEVNKWLENGREISVGRIKESDLNDLSRAHKILEVARVAAKLVSAAR